ncbi:MAG: MBL fold metallo-hydrolase [Alphaproteobacteria bacterium]|jgi:phosphoribosyl 1,2-cyclic phosphodiesterase|nr:MBL fold metallo-hydrolase [Alphaproteobacteria bacterium]
MADTTPDATAKPEFFVRFWGVRGSISTSDAGTQRYGGNTSCLEIRCGERFFIFDAGTGIRYLGNAMCGGDEPLDGDIFLTHTHFDHICGIPFFRPFFDPKNRFRLWAGHLLPDHTLRQVLEDMMIAPLFPVPPSIFGANIQYKDFRVGEEINPCPSVAIKTAPLNHPNGCSGYRVEFDGRSICYLTDTEHLDSGLDQNILALIQGADIVIYDSMYTPEQYETRIGWGHSTWREGVRLCDAAGVKTFVVFHHDPDHDDDFMDRLGREAETARPGTVVAYEGLVLRP